nr:MAG TPA: hypothetical protein [Caudoviricetes sp.]
MHSMDIYLSVLGFTSNNSTSKFLIQMVQLI